MRGITIAALAAAAMIAAVSLAPQAQASDRGSLNGSFTATSNGEWARTNDVFRNEVSVASSFFASLSLYSRSTRLVALFVSLRECFL